ncbi:MAG TPA: META domain-containing protein, partial [Chloroflexia bacterium]|nr:META domain-containing protein [Chloroflexia bacterium]
SRLPLLGIVAGALLAVGSLLALSAAGIPSSGANGGNMAAPAAQPTTTSITPTATLTGTLWEWERTETNDGTVVTAVDPARYTVEFLDGGQMAIRADCNRGSGTYTTNGPELTITPGAFTRIGCPPDTQDQVFLRDLERVGSYLFSQGKLVLELRFDSGGMTFREAQLTTQQTPIAGATPGAGGSGLTGGLWQWLRTDMGGTSTTVPNPSQYTLELLPDGSGGIRADCNIGNLSYVLTGTDGIDITLGVSTLVACPPGSLDTEYRRQLEEAATYQVQGDNLTLGLPRGGSMVFARTAAQPTATPIDTPEPLPTAAPTAPTTQVPGMPRTGAKD